MKNSLEALTSRYNLTYEFNWGNLVWGTKRKKMKNNEVKESKTTVGQHQSYQHMNICIMGGPEGEKERSRKNIWRNNGWKRPNLMKSINLHIQKSQWTPSWINLMKSSVKYIIIKLSKDKAEENFESSKRRKKKKKKKTFTMYKGPWMRLTAEFSSDTMKARNSGMTYSKCLKKKHNCQQAFSSSKTIL